jgi:pimeloyl-ACP methyl ester carboxylesterase
MRVLHRRTLVAVLVVANLAVGGAAATAVEVPVLSKETPGGSLQAVTRPPTPPGARRVDGAISDWAGTTTGYGGTTVYSAGELVYQDHLFDAWGADDGTDAQRLSLLDPLAQAVPQTYRLDALIQSDAPGEFGVPTPEQLSGSEHYGDLRDMAAHADLEELRVAADSSRVWLLARTTTMTDPASTAVLVLADTVPGSPPHDVPFNSGLRSGRADVALLLAGHEGWVADLAGGTVAKLPPHSVATSDTGYRNAVEAAIPRSLLVKSGQSMHLALATGTFDGNAGLAGLGLNANVANVAFRTHEPVRVWWDKQQALSIYQHTVDPFFADVDLAKLTAGVTQTTRVKPGYHDRIFLSSPSISQERGTDGVFQSYGLYVPGAYRPGQPLPLTFWLHWRGGRAHSAAAWTPRVMQEFGEDRGGLVVSPGGRGSSQWYVGRGMADFLEVWDDVLSTFPVDQDRVYVTGHSMGGWGSYLMSVLFPDRFAAAAPVSPPVTQGAFTGLDFPGCDEFRYDEYTPCYVQANGGDARTEWTLPLLDNLRNTPMAIYAGGVDELVPVGGEIRQAQRLAELGYRHRFYLFPTYEHYTPPIVDEWTEFARYFDQFRRPRNPARVTYVRSMPFERAVENGPDLSHPAGLSFAFDRAWWMSELTPGDPGAGVARFDGRSLAIPEPPVRPVPEAGGPTAVGQTGPYAMSGITWMADPLGTAAPAANGFDVTLAGASAVRLDLVAMKLTLKRPLSGAVTTDHDLVLRLAGPWARPPKVLVNGLPVSSRLVNGVLSVRFVPGASRLQVIP